MNFGKIGAATAVTTMVIAGSLLGAEPAKAISVGDVLSFTTTDITSGTPTLVENMDGTFTFSMGNISINPETSPVFGNEGDPITFADLTLTNVGGNQYTLAETTPFTWITGGLLDSRTYNLESFSLTATQILPTSLFTFSSIGFSGFFEPPGINGIGALAGVGQLTVDGSGVVSGAIEVVPTPAAVLPGLAGMATAAFRKKKQEEDNELATVGAESQA
ncbi:PTPA-CTERM sorting domain-containing protein [Leptothoe sp. LEGE 181152]|nr:PTPA-CTERM sorting domain-containing protein [Leptothoe sp. LEGE 181152]